MSDAALTIWISCGSLLVSACSLVISVAAYRRSDTLRRLDRLSELSRDIADLRPRLDKLERTIPKALQSRVPPAAVLGHGLRAGADAAAVREPRGQPDEAASKRQAGPNAAPVREPRGQPDEVASKRQAGPNAAPVREPRGQPDEVASKRQAGANAAAVREPRSQPDEAASIPKRVDYAGMATKSVTARQASTRLEQLVQYMQERAGRPR